MSDEWGNQIPGIFKGAAEKQRENALYRQMMDAPDLANVTTGISPFAIGQAAGKGLTVASGSSDVLIDGNLRVKGKLNVEGIGGEVMFGLRKIRNGYILRAGRNSGDLCSEDYLENLDEVGARIISSIVERELKSETASTTTRR